MGNVHCTSPHELFLRGLAHGLGRWALTHSAPGFNVGLLFFLVLACGLWRWAISQVVCWVVGCGFETHGPQNIFFY
jgi:hypothetical protein